MGHWRITCTHCKGRGYIYAEIKCPGCGVLFVPTRKQGYCSTHCRQRFQYAKFVEQFGGRRAYNLLLKRARREEKARRNG